MQTTANKTFDMNHVDVHYLEATHGYFPELVRILVTLSSIGLSLEVHQWRTVKPYGSSDYLTLAGKGHVSGIEISFVVGPIYQRLLSPSKRMPKYLKAIKRPIKRPIDHSVSHPLQVSKVQPIVVRLVADAFLSYYARHVEAVESEWGKVDKGNWPTVWQFGRVIRNAIAHDGKIFFESRKAPPVHWLTLKYSYSDNNLKRQLLYDEITGVELILLMEDMDSVLRAARDTNAANETFS